MQINGILGRFAQTFAKEDSCLSQKKNPCFKISKIIHRLPEYRDAEHRQKGGNPNREILPISYNNKLLLLHAEKRRKKYFLDA